MGFLEDLTWYVWNWAMYIKSMEALVLCYYAGTIGLVFDDDDGDMQKWCWGLYDNKTMVNFPASFVSSYAPEESS